MALTKPIEIYWVLFQNSYAKIMSTSTMEVGEINGEKQYECTIWVNFYTDSTKQYPYHSENFRLQGLTLSQLSLPSLYNELKTLAYFSWYTDI